MSRVWDFICGRSPIPEPRVFNIVEPLETLRLPDWLKDYAFGGFREQGWNAYDQRNGGRVAASGQWGDAVTVDNGSIRNVSQMMEGE